MLIHSKLPEKFWAEAILNANYVTNRTPTKNKENKTPFELWVGHIPSVRHMHCFGAKVYSLIKGQQKKFSDRAEEGIFLGYSETSKAYSIWLTKQNKLNITRDIKVLNEMYNNDKSSTQNEYLNLQENTNNTSDAIPISILQQTKINENIEEDNINIPFQQSNIEEGLNKADNSGTDYTEVPTIFHSRPQRERKPPKRLEEYVSDFCENENYDENSIEWQLHIRDEIKAHLKNDTWQIVERNN